VNADETNRFLRGMLDRGECDMARLEPWLRAAVTPLR
jgi:hypothetical protein